jgi:hypothetical protein
MMVNEITKIMWIKAKLDNSLTCMLSEKQLNRLKNEYDMDFWK